MSNTPMGLNDMLLGSGLDGLSAAADAFAASMAERARRKEAGNNAEAQVYMEYAQELQGRLIKMTSGYRDLQQQLAETKKELSEKDVLIERAAMQITKFSEQSAEHADYVNVLCARIRKVEDVMQRQSANSYALSKLHELMQEQLKGIQNPEVAALIDPVKQKDFIDEKWNEFNSKTNMRKGVPKPGDKA